MAEKAEQEKKRKLWFIRRSGEIKGPFPSGTMRRFILLGRVKTTDEVSLDRKNWQDVLDVPEVVPPEIRKAAAEGHLDEVLPISLKEDERTGRERRRKDSDGQYKNQRKGQRRKEEPELVQRHRKAKQELLKEEKAQRKTPYAGVIASAVVAILLIGLGLYIGAPESIPDADCTAKAGPGVNWRSCYLEQVSAESANLEGAVLNSTILRQAKLTGSNFKQADMQYADMSGSDLSYSEFTSARMKGINLQNADLTNADMRNSDLTYANLKNSSLGGARMEGARLEKAIWVDGTVCAPGSIGGCLKP